MGWVAAIIPSVSESSPSPPYLTEESEVMNWGLTAIVIVVVLGAAAVGLGALIVGRKNDDSFDKTLASIRRSEETDRALAYLSDANLDFLNSLRKQEGLPHIETIKHVRVVDQSKEEQAK